MVIYCHVSLHYFFEHHILNNRLVLPTEHVHLLLQLIYVGKASVPLEGYADFIETAKSLKLDRFVYQDFSLHYDFGSDGAGLDFDGTGRLEWKAADADDGGANVTADAAIEEDDSAEGQLVIDEPDERIPPSPASTTVATVFPSNQTLLVEDVPVGGIGGQVALKRHPRIVFDSEREIMRVIENGADDDDDGELGNGNELILRLHFGNIRIPGQDGDGDFLGAKRMGHLDSPPQMLLVPPPLPSLPLDKPSQATGK